MIYLLTFIFFLLMMIALGVGLVFGKKGIQGIQGIQGNCSNLNQMKRNKSDCGNCACKNLSKDNKEVDYV